jgi:hypothetical protein
LIQKTDIVLVALILIAALVTPVVAAANTTYPQEYYSLGDTATQYMKSGNDVSGWGPGIFWETFAIATEFHRQNILMERQNELLATQNKIQFAELCIPAMKYSTYAAFCDANQQVLVTGVTP